MKRIHIPGSKSISNRLLLIKAIGDLSCSIENLSDSDDTTFLQKNLADIQQHKRKLNVGHAGTTFRFLCAYLCALENYECTLEGSKQLHARPIKPLVEALQQLGAEINYEGRKGFPPLHIKGKKLKGGYLEIDSQISSQFISALLLTAPMLENSLHLKLKGNTVSASYIKLTSQIMKDFGVTTEWFSDSECTVKPQKYQNTVKSYFNESDWSGAGYFYSAMALNNLDDFQLNGLFKNSLQPDAVVCELFKGLGVETLFTNNDVRLKKTSVTQTELSYDFTLCPDLAQTMVVCCAGLGLSVHFTGLSTLPLKETNRLQALKQELLKIGVDAIITDNSISFKNPSINIDGQVNINTYHDHRMAMSFAPLAMRYPQIKINDAGVVSKSFPDFWTELDKLK